MRLKGFLVTLPLALVVPQSGASALTLFSLDFENPAYALPSADNGQRSVAMIQGLLDCGSNPSVDPICRATTNFPVEPGLTNEATDSAINVRKATNPINTETALGFDGFFEDRFLVIGDNSGELAGGPNGQPDGSIAISELRIQLPDLGNHTIRISYDFVFDTNRNASEDDWAAELLAGLDVTSLQFFGEPDRNGDGTRGHFSLELDPAGLTELVFRLVEYNGTGTSAVGIDRILIEQVPEPQGLATLLLGLAALWGRRKASAR